MKVYAEYVTSESINEIRRKLKKKGAIRVTLGNITYYIINGYEVVTNTNKSSVGGYDLGFIMGEILECKRYSRSIWNMVDPSKCTTIVDMAKQYNRLLKEEIHNYERVKEVAKSGDIEGRCIKFEAKTWDMSTSVFKIQNGEVIRVELETECEEDEEDIKRRLCINENLKYLCLDSAMIRKTLVNKKYNSYKNSDSISYDEFIDYLFGHILINVKELPKCRHILKSCKFRKETGNNSKWFDFVDVYMSLCLPYEECKDYVIENKKALYTEALSYIENKDQFKGTGLPITSLEISGAVITRARELIIKVQWKKDLCNLVQS